jgi:hypothetical protein
MMEIGNGNPGLSVAEARTQFSLWCLMKSPLLIGASLQSITHKFLNILRNEELIAWNQDDAGLQGYLRASAAYEDGDTRSAALAAEAAHALAAIAASQQRAHLLDGRRRREAIDSGDINSSFQWLTYCAHGAHSIPAAQKFALGRHPGARSAAVQQGNACLTARGAGGVVTMQACNHSREGQSWHADLAAVTVAPIKTADGLCLATDGRKLITEACVARPENCSSLWNHNSSANGIDCTDDNRHRQLWYLSKAGQLISTYAKGKGTQHHPDIVFYDPDDPLCVATSAAARPTPPSLPPSVNYSLPLQVWAGCGGHCVLCGGCFD